MRREYARDEFRLGPLIALFDSLAEDMVVYDNGCKTCPVSATHISKEFDKGEIGSSQDASTQDAFKYVDSLSTAAGGGGSNQINEDAEIEQLAYQIQKKYGELLTLHQLLNRNNILLSTPELSVILKKIGYKQNMTVVQKQKIMTIMHSKLQEIEDMTSGKKKFSKMFGGKSKTKRRRPQKKSTRKKRR